MCLSRRKQFNWNTWAEFATSSSPNKDIKLYLGLPGSPTAAGSGYVTSDVVKNALANVIKSLDSNFGGISIWDASQAFANSVSGVNFAESMKSILAEVFGGQATSPTTSTSPVTPSTTSTTSTTPVAPTTTSTTSTTPVVPTTTSTTPVAPTTTSTTSTTPVAPTTTSTIPVAPTTTSTTSTTPVAPTTTSTIPVAPTTTSTTSTTPVAPTTTSTTSTTPVVPTTTSATTPNGKDVQLSFTKSISTSSSVVTTAITLNPTTTLATVTKTSSTSASTTSIPASATTTPASSSFKDCSSLTGKDKAVCLNTNFANNLFSSGSADSYAMCCRYYLLCLHTKRSS
ncbi:unnamed protein product [[Candida] boidinii]|nr:unnamed protein product [[Candida] boidinii]